jgi:hypothetical protein
VEQVIARTRQRAQGFNYDATYNVIIDGLFPPLHRQDE